MKKDQLKTGMLVQIMNKNWYMVCNGAKKRRQDEIFLLNILDGCYISSESYSNDLEYDGSPGYQIVKVAECNFVGNVIRGIREHKSPENFKEFKVIWERTDPKVAEVEALVAKLQEQLREAQDELGRLR